MSLARSIIKNTFWLISAEILGNILLAITGLILARYLGTASYGKFSFVFSFAALFSIFADFGLSNYFVNKVASDKSKLQTYFDNIITLKIFTSIISFFIIFLATYFINQPLDIKISILLAGFYVIAISYNALFFSIFRVQEKMKYEAILKTIQNLLVFVFLLFAIFLHFRILKLVEFYVYPAIISLAITSIFIYKKAIRFKFKIDLTFWKNIIREIPPFALIFPFITIYYYISIVILSFLKNDQIVGQYNAAYKILLIILVLIALYYTAIFPVVSRLFTQSKEKLALLLKITTRGALILGLPIAFGFYILNKPIMMLLYGSEFTDGAEALKIMGFIALVIFLSYAYGNSLLACAQRNKYAIGILLGMAANVILGFVLIPKFNIEGASLAVLIAEIFVFIYMYYIFSKNIFKVSFGQFIIKPLVASIIMAFGLYYLKDYNIFLLILLGILIYFSVLIIFKGIKKEDFAFVRSIIKS